MLDLCHLSLRRLTRAGRLDIEYIVGRSPTYLISRHLSAFRKVWRSNLKNKCEWFSDRFCSSQGKHLAIPL